MLLLLAQSIYFLGKNVSTKNFLLAMHLNAITQVISKFEISVHFFHTEVIHFCSWGICYYGSISVNSDSFLHLCSTLNK